MTTTISPLDTAIIQAALEKCLQLKVQMPQVEPLNSVQRQLEYLLEVLNGTITDRTRLNEVVLGRYAARELESRDMEFALLLYRVEEIVDSMKRI